MSEQAAATAARSQARAKAEGWEGLIVKEAQSLRTSPASAARRGAS